MTTRFTRRVAPPPVGGWKACRIQGARLLACGRLSVLLTSDAGRGSAEIARSNRHECRGWPTGFRRIMPMPGSLSEFPGMSSGNADARVREPRVQRALRPDSFALPRGPVRDARGRRSTSGYARSTGVAGGGANVPTSPGRRSILSTSARCIDSSVIIRRAYSSSMMSRPATRSRSLR